jgi:hypothetical protein
MPAMKVAPLELLADADCIELFASTTRAADIDIESAIPEVTTGVGTQRNV